MSFERLHQCWINLSVHEKCTTLDSMVDPDQVTLVDSSLLLWCTFKDFHSSVLHPCGLTTTHHSTWQVILRCLLHCWLLNWTNRCTPRSWYLSLLLLEHSCLLLFLLFFLEHEDFSGSHDDSVYWMRVTSGFLERLSRLVFGSGFY
jgi:hypothetical protein